MPNRRFVIWSLIVFGVLAAFLWLSPRSADAAEFNSPLEAVELIDADFCFGPAGVSFACNSECFANPDPSYRSLPISCPGPAASIVFATHPSTVFCGSQSTLSVTVEDAKGIPVANDTLVTFTTNGGVVSASGATYGGLASASFLVHAKTSGVANIVATVGGIRAEHRIDVGCN